MVDFRSSCDESSIPTGGQPLSQTQYNKGDFIYFQGKKGHQEINILQIDRIWTNSEDVPMVYGNCYFRSVFFVSFEILFQCF